MYTYFPRSTPRILPRHMRDRSKYQPHQSIKERMRRVGQIMRGHLPDQPISDGVKEQYIDYSTKFALGQAWVTAVTQSDGPELAVQGAGVLEAGHYDELDVQVPPEEG